MTAPTVDQRLAQAIQELKDYGAQKIILFGSAARGEVDEYSDLDLVVIKPTGQRFLERLREVVKRCPVAGGEDVLVYTPEEWQRMAEHESPFAEAVERERRVVYEAQH
ncbi:MAG: nucleotidyltransferase domain-containing protein [Candidatus Omnitrophica bacterium]|nr:nucleotidyltransferase domain-containing protein [Candidatus Omnitrophota bacterium]